jgi:DNA-binding IclR family transcriptional regulator
MRERTFAIAAQTDAILEARGRASFAAAVKEFEEKGFCSSYGDWRPDVNGIAVPVFSPNGSLVYGLNIGGPAFHVKKKQLETVYAKRLIKAAEAISIRI